MHSAKSLPTALGIVAIVFWSTTIAYSRFLTGALGTFTASAIIYTLAGVLGCLQLLVRRGALRRALASPKGYLLGCGSLCVICMTCLYAAIGFSTSDKQVIEVSVINYLWPGMTLILSLPILGRKAKPWLMGGVLLSFAGVFLALRQEGDLTWAGFVNHLTSEPAPYLLALAAAVSWAFYSTLSRRSGADSGAMPLFLLASGLVLWLIRACVNETPTWSWKAVLLLGYLAVFPALLAYTFWDLAMRKGRIVLVAALSYLTPILSIAFTSFYLSVRPSWMLWLACAMVVAGAFISKWSISDPVEKPKRQ